MSISVLSLLVGHDGLGTIGLNLRLLGFAISMNSNFYVFWNYFYFLGHVNVWQSVKKY